MTVTFDNNSGQGKAAPVPPEINRWNWGAFLLHWIWGIGNSTPIAFLVFVPFVGLVMIFVLGAKGSAWAWRNRKWDSVEHFRRVQRKWAIWGVIVWGVFIAFVVAIFFLVSSVIKSSEAFRLGLDALNANAQAVQLLGTPLSVGSPQGNISINGSTGEATLNFSVTGSKAHGTVELKASKHFDVWRLDSEELQIDGRAGVIELAK